MYFYTDIFRGHTRFESAGLFSARGPWIHPARTLPSYELILVLEGRFTLRIGENEGIYRQGDFLILPPRTPHTGVLKEEPPIRFFWLHFHSREFSALMSRENVLNHYSAADPNRVLILPQFSSTLNMQSLYIMCLHIVHIYQDHASPIYLNHYTNTVLSEISHQTVRELKLRPGGTGKLQPVQEWIRLHACEPISLEQIAAEFQYNPSYLSRKYKEEMGLGIVDQITGYRLDKAKRLLMNSSKTVQEIAYEVGYNDPKYFMRIFRQQELMTPTEYRHTFYQRHMNQ